MSKESVVPFVSQYRLHASCPDARGWMLVGVNHTSASALSGSHLGGQKATYADEGALSPVFVVFESAVSSSTHSV